MAIETRKPSLNLTVIGADGAVNEQSFAQESIILGSGDTANVQISDEKVSGVHAMLKVADGKVMVIDLGSETGTLIGGEAVREHEIASGDVVQLGDSKVRVAFEAGDGASADRLKVKNGRAEPKEPPPAPAKAKIVDLDPLRQAGVAKLFSEQLAPEDKPTQQGRQLEVVMIWADTVIAVHHFGLEGGADTVTLGEDSDVDFHLSSDRVPTTRFPVARREGSEWVIQAGEEMGLQVRNAQGQRNKEALQGAGELKAAIGEFKGEAYKVGLEDSVVLSVDDTAFVFRYVKPSAKIVHNPWETFDFYFTKVFSTSFVAHVLFLFALALTPVNTDDLSDDLFKNPNRFTRLLLVEQEEEVIKIEEDFSGVEEGAKADEEEGKFGEEEAEQEEAAPSKEGAPVVDVNKREEDRKKVMNSALLAALSGADDDAASSVLGPGGIGTGVNEAFGGTNGAAGQGDANGVGGMGARGTGGGGGGTGLGMGGLGTKGGGRGKGGSGKLDLGGSGRGKTKIKPGKTTVSDGLDKDVIARVVRKNQKAIKACYEKGLARDPNLGGKVSVSWTIGPNGSVIKTSIAESGMRDPAVEGCIMGHVRTWKFPNPRGGGVVHVTYPWVFTSGS